MFQKVYMNFYGCINIIIMKMSQSSQQQKNIELTSLPHYQNSQQFLSPNISSQPIIHQNATNSTQITPQTSSQISMTIKQQQTIQQILQQVLNNQSNKNTRYGARQRNNGRSQYAHNYDFNNFQNNYQLDEDIEKLLKQSELQIERQYQTMAREQFLRNRMSISIFDQQDKLKQIFQRMDARSQRQRQAKANDNLRKHRNSQHQFHSLEKLEHTRKQSMMSQTSNQSRARRQSVASNDKSQGFGTAFNLDANNLKLSYPFDDDSFIQSSDGEDGKYLRAKSYINIPSYLNKDRESNQYNQVSSSSQESSNDQLIDSTKFNINLKPQTKNQNTQSSQYILDKFEREQIHKPKQQTLQILQLDQKYPKINPMSMYRHQYPIFKFKQSSTSKYVKFMRKSMNEINSAVAFVGQNGAKWTILAIQHQLYVFIGQDWKQPIIINPQRNINNTNNLLSNTNKIITSMELSPHNNFLAISLGTQIIIYQIKKQTNSLVLVKNLNSSDDLNAKLIKINKIKFYDQNPIKIAYIDNYENIGLLTVQQIMLFTRVGEKSVQHGLDIVMDMDVLSIDTSNNHENSAQKIQQVQPKKSSGFSFGKFNQKITNLISKTNTGYLAFASRSQLMLFRIQPNIQLLHTQALREQTTRDISVRWRYNAQNQTKPQLLIAYNNKIYIYKLIQADTSSADSRRQAYLQIHLMYQNHYDITQMEIISNTHLLLHSNQNIIIIAIPLIPSTDLSLTDSSENQQPQTRQRSKSGSYNQMFQSALIFITSQKQCRVLFTSMDQVIYYSSKQEKLQVAMLKTLQQYIDELMLQKGHFRQAFTLLMLVHKGVNYSFKFSYTSQALAQCIFSAIQCTIGSLILSMDDNIVQYRLGWVCQLLVQTHNQNMIWNTVYKKLQQKQKQRQRQLNLQIKKINEQIQQSQSKKQKQRQSYYEVLNTQNPSQNTNKNKGITKNSSLQSLKRQQRKSKFLSHHHFSTILHETTSSQLLPKESKNLQHILFDILEVFVLKSFITSIPQNIFLQFVQYQCQKMSDTILEKIITQNKSAYDGSKLLSLLQNKQRNYLQLFLFSRALICDQADFYTPFIKVFASFKSQNQKIQKSNNKQVDEQAVKKMNNTGMICLWYLRKCLRFQRIPSGIMPLNQKMAIVQTLCAQILEPAFTKKLFAFNSKVFLQTYLFMFLDSELSIMIQQQNQFLVQKYKQFYPEIYQSIMSVPPSPTQLIKRKSVSQLSQQIFDKAFKQLILLHLQKTIPAIKNQNLLWCQFLALAFYFNKTQVCLTFQAVVDVLIVLFQNKFDDYNLYVPPKISPRPSIQQLQLSLIDYIKPILIQKKDKFYMNKLISFNDKNVSYYLFRIDQNYKQALEHFISSRDANKLIPFIYQLLGDIKQIGKDNQDNYNDKIFRQRKFADLKQILVRNIGLLFKIDKFQALNIFYEIGETSQTIYNLIQQNLGNKLDFLTAVLKKFQHEDFDMKQRFQLEHLSEVCTLSNKKMLAFLDQFNYPLDQGIIVCQQKGNLLAKAILQERNGKISDAFMSYERIVKGIIQSNSNNSNSNQKLKSQKQIKRDVRKYTDQCIRICKHYSYDTSTGPQNNFWLRIITFINGFIKSNSQHKVFLKVQFQKVLQHILSEMFQFLPTNVLIDFFITKGHRLELSLTKQFSIFQNLFVLARFDINVCKKVLQIFKLDIKDTRKQALIKRKNGIICSGLCDFCKKQLGQQANCNVYSCKHAFHKLCHQDIYRCLTCYYESDNSILSSNIFGTQLAKGGMEQSEQLYLKDKNAKKKLKAIANINIIVESSQLARQDGVKKKLKVFDFTQQKENELFYNNINIYNEKQKQKQKQDKQQQFQNQYLRYTKAKGLQIKEKPKQLQNQIFIHNVSSYKE